MAGGSRDEPLHVDCATVDPVVQQTLADLAENVGRDYAGPRTIILDRIAELPLGEQSRLVERIVSSRSRKHAAPRFVATICKPLIGAPTFHQLATELRQAFDVTLTVPPLRRRRPDIAALGSHFLRGVNPSLALDTRALRALEEYPFPGNVRELRNLMTRLAIMTRPSPGEPGASETIAAADVRNQLAGLYRAAGIDSVIWKLTRERARRQMALFALSAADDDRGKATANLGIAPPAPIRMAATATPKSRRPRSRGP